VFDQFYASQLPSIPIANATMFNRDAIVALLEKIGPAIVMTHSQSGAFGWPVADLRPDLVKAILAVEPSGPPFFDIENIGAPDWFRDTSSAYRVWGPTAAPLTYSPPATSPSDLAIVREEKADAPDVIRCWMQKSPARQLPNLQKMPILIVTAEASYHATYDHCTVKYLQQAGVHPTWMKLGEAGIRGNGHMLMLEANSAEVAEAMSRWLSKAVK
jgi:pimeloyl-ACP methyl ester carboxylesterase